MLAAATTLDLSPPAVAERVLPGDYSLEGITTFDQVAVLSGLFPQSLTADALVNFKRQYARGANVINFPCTLLQGFGEGQPDLRQQEMLNNVYTAVIEHAIADAVGQYRYRVSTRELDCMEPSYQEGIANTAGQIPQFELPRNRANFDFYLKLQAAAHNGRLKSETMVEISPTPAAFDHDASIRQRGYLGNDTISFYRQTAEGEIEIDQYWFPRANSAAYRGLAENLAALDPGNKQLAELAGKKDLTDLDLMRCSGSFTAAQITQIQEFISSRQLLVAENRGLIENFAERVTKAKVIEQVLPRLYSLAGSLLQNNPDSEIHSGLSDLAAQLEKLQFELRLFICQAAAKDTFDSETAQHLAAHNITYSTFAESTDAEQMQQMQSSGFTATGCGFVSGSAVEVKAAASIWGNSNTVLNRSNRIQFTNHDRELYEFVCGSCGHKHSIDVPNGVYVEKCENCGANARC